MITALKGGLVMILITVLRAVRDICAETARLRRELARRYPDVASDSF
jgi:hypothetical protein